MNHSIKGNINFAQLVPVYIYTGIIKTNLVGDSYVRPLTSLHIPLDTGYHRFVYPLYTWVEQSYIESISIRLVMKTGEIVLFERGYIPCLVILHIKNKFSGNKRKIIWFVRLIKRFLFDNLHCIFLVLIVF